MDLKKSSLLILLLSIILCGCSQKEKIIIEVPGGNPVANSYMDSAGEAIKQSDYVTALNYYLKAEDIYLNLKDSNENELAGIYNMIGRCYMQLSNYYKAEEYLKKSAIIGEKKSDETLNFDNYINLMKIYYSITADMEMALDYGKKSEILAIKLYGDKSSELSEVYSDFSKIYLNMEDYDTAYNYIKKALNITNDLYGENSEDSAIIYKDLADMYKKQKQYDSAKDYLEKAVEIFENKNNQYWLAYVYSDLGSISSDIKEYENALNYYNKSLEVYDKWGEIDFDLAKIHYWRAESLYNLKKYELSKQELLLSHQICKSLPIQSELTAALITYIKDDLKVIYDYNFEGDKSDGFEAWYKELISTQAVQ